MNRTGTILLFLSVTCGVSAQEVIHYDITDGLSSIEVNDIRGNDNYTWIATSDGLNRFDSENFKVYKRNNSENSLTGNNIETLYFDSEGLLWIGLKTGGADIYDPRRDRFTHLDRLIRSPLPARVIAIKEDSQKNIWLGTWEEGVYKLIPENSERSSFRTEIHYPGFIVSAICEKPEGYVRIGTYSGAFVYSIAEGKWYDSGLKNAAVTQFLESGQENMLWCSTWSTGLLLLSWDEKDPSRSFIARKFDDARFSSIHRILAANEGKIFLGTWGEGVKVLDTTTLELSPYPFAPGNRSGQLVNCLYNDRSGNTWIGAFGGGIYKLIRSGNFLRNFPAEDRLPAPAVALADYRDGKILAGTQGKGIYFCDPWDKHLISAFKEGPEGSFSNYILSLYTDEKYILAGHDGSGITYCMHGDRNPAEIRMKELTGIRELEKVTAFLPVHGGRIWVGTKQNGLFSVHSDPVRGVLDNPVHYASFGRDEITGFAELNDRQIFISSHNGLFVLNTDNGTVSPEGKIMTNEIVYRILRDDDNSQLWIGTSADLLRLDLTRPLTPVKAIPDDIIPQGAVRVLLSDNNNNIWFAVQDHLFCLITREQRICEITPARLEKKAILSGTVLNDGGREYLVFGTTEKLIIIEPKLFLRQLMPPKILFTGLDVDYRKTEVGEKVYGNVILNEASEYARTIKLSHKCRWISLSFAEKDCDMYKDKFQFRIKGLSDKWQYLDFTKPVVISQLNPGKYTFEIRRYSLGVETGISWALDAIILPPWWATGWFLSLLVLLVAVIMVMAVLLVIRHYRKRHLQRLDEIEKQKEAELLMEKESFFAGLSHDLMTPFSLIISPVNDLLRESRADDPRKEKLEIISKNTSFLSDVFGTILDFKRAELSETTVSETGVEIVSYSRMALNAFEYLAKSRKIELSFRSNCDELHVSTDKLKIERILFNLISNAMKFTPDAGNVSLNLDYNFRGMLTFRVIDNGCGMNAGNSAVFEKFYREPDKEVYGQGRGLGLGLYIVRKFVTLLNGSIDVSSVKGKGTEIRINLPVRQIDKVTTTGKDIRPVAMDISLSTILFVEDNEQMREYVSKKLAHGFNVITACNGFEALQLIDKYIPEIIITDVVMPEMDGLELCRRIKSNSRFSDMFVALISAKSGTVDELAAYRSGADIFIKKPIDSEVLLNQILNIHSTRQRRQGQFLADLLSKDDTEIRFDARETFLKRSMKIVEENIMDADFKIDRFAAEMNMSNTVLHRKFKLYVGQTPNQFIRLVRLRKSVSLLRNTDLTIAEIAHLTGFNQSHYFIKCFRESYRDTPGNFREQSRKEGTGIN